MTEPPVRSPWARTVLRIAAIVTIAWVAHLALGWSQGLVASGGLGMRLGMLALFLVIYALLISVPFVPGVEIGLTLLAMEGAWIAPWVYLATLCGLVLAFLVGERLPYPRLRAILSDLRLREAARLLDTLEPMDRDARLARLHEHAPRLLRPLATRFRYVFLAVLVNLPGSALIGGGGGILFAAGLTRMFRPWETVATLALAVAPVPFVVWHLDINLLETVP